MKLKRIFIPLAALGMAATLAGCGETDPQIISNKNKKINSDSKQITLIKFFLK